MSTVRLHAGELFFEWDTAKAAANRRKHGVSFEEALTVFNDPLARVRDEADVVDGEERLLIVGQSEQRRLLVVVHVERGRTLRLISARPLTRHERAKLEQR